MSIRANWRVGLRVLRLHVCMYECVHAGPYVCMYVCLQACVRACMHVNMYVCMFASNMDTFFVDMSVDVNVAR